LLPNGKYHLPVAPYNFSIDEKISFLKVLKHMKVPNGCTSNISQCVNLKECKLFNLKSHGCHSLMYDLLPITLRVVKDENLVDFACELSDFFKELCAKEINVDKLDKLQSNVVLMLWRL